LKKRIPLRLDTLRTQFREGRSVRRLPKMPVTTILPLLTRL
uniref:Histone domain-containing protein n=1 Tax=Heligmosomoides polygyrus TaxID=6339 RepID=A0A183FHP2_HELPZ